MLNSVAHILKRIAVQLQALNNKGGLPYTALTALIILYLFFTINPHISLKMKNNEFNFLLHIKINLLFKPKSKWHKLQISFNIKIFVLGIT